MKKAQPFSLDLLGKLFLQDQKLKGVSDQTLIHRKLGLLAFIRWAQRKGVVRIQQVTFDVIEHYQGYLYQKRDPKTKQLIKANTIYAYLITVRLFFRWLIQKDLLLENPTGFLVLPKYDRKSLRDSLSLQEAEKLLNAPDCDTLVGLRDKAILETFYSTGIRRSELIDLKIRDVDFSGIVTVQSGKGGKKRLVPIGRRALDWIQKYLMYSRPFLENQNSPEILFLSQQGNGLSKKTLTHLIWLFKKQVNIDKKGSCHLFRHTMATQMLKNGADLRVIQEILGHSKIETTEIYTHLDISHLKAIHKVTHPAEITESV